MSYIGEDVLRKLYTEDKMAMKEIAEMIGVSVGSVCKTRKVKNCVWRYAE